MKQKFYSGAVALALIGLASCSSEAPDNLNQAAVDGDRYIAFQIRNVGEGTRADEGNSFDGYEGSVKAEDGTLTENKIDPTKVRFYFFDATGNPWLMSPAGVNGSVYSNMVTPTNISNAAATVGSDCSISGTLVLGTAAEGYKGTVPAYMICAVNLDDSGFEALRNKDLLTLLNQSVNKTSGEPDTELFPMTSATYQDATYFGTEIREDGVGFYTKLEDGVNIFTDPEQAENAPAHVYIERLAAKVRVKGLGTYLPKKKDADGNLVEATYPFTTYTAGTGESTTSQKTLKVRLDKWRTVNNLSTVKYIKNLNPTSAPINNSYNWTWNDAANHRSYWATTLSEDIVNNNYNIYDTSNTKVWFGEYTGTSDNPIMANSDYIFPNCAFWNAPSKLSDRTTNATGVLVQATVGEDVDGTFTPLSFVEWAGRYYLEDDFKDLVLAGHTGYTREDVSFEILKTADHTTGINKYTVCVGKDNDGNPVPCTHYQDVMYWKGGVTSYYVNVQHAASNTTPIYGIVRNHIYDMNMTDVIGLGIPGNDKKEPEPETESFVACHIDVLNWHVVKNNIVLE